MSLGDVSCPLAHLLSERAEPLALAAMMRTVRENLHKQLQDTTLIVTKGLCDLGLNFTRLKCKELQWQTEILVTLEAKEAWRVTLSEGGVTWGRKFIPEMNNETIFYILKQCLFHMTVTQVITLQNKSVKCKLFTGSYHIHINICSNHRCMQWLFVCSEWHIF